MEVQSGILGYAFGKGKLQVYAQGNAKVEYRSQEVHLVLDSDLGEVYKITRSEMYVES
jgi:hypothetical protein